MKIRKNDVPRLVCDYWGMKQYTTAPEIVYCCPQAANASAVFDVIVSKDGRIIATLWSCDDGEDDEHPMNFCPWCGTPINEEES